MTATTMPPPVDDLVPAAIALAERTRRIPSKRQLMQTLRIGRPKAVELQRRVRVESVKRGSRRAVKLAEATRPQQPRRTASARLFDASVVPVSPGVGPADPWKASVPVAVRPTPDAVRLDTPAAPVPSQARRVKAWPLLLLALPAFVAIWSGWVGLGGLTGFGVVHPLPGIFDDVSINTAITLPIGLETYAAYALYVWLSGAVVSARARTFAMWSALLSLTLGAGGQITYHLLVSDGPWVITTIVACLPVAVLGMGAALYHLVHVDEKGELMAKDKAARDAATREYKEAHQKLEENAERERKAKIRHETEEYLKLNDRASRAAQNPNLPWWRR